jgi:DHA1 family tetracycline resistance protein-like MFS transporter
MSIAAVIGPVLVTQVFAAFTGPSAPVYFPGAPFLMGAGITVAAAVLLKVVLKRHPTPEAEVAPSTTGAPSD